MATIKKLEPGKWQLRIKYIDKVTKKSRYIMRRFKTKAEAEESELKILNEINNQQNIFEKISLVDFIDKWLTEQKLNKVADNTYRTYRYSLNKYIKPHFDKLDLKELNPIDYQKFINSLIEQKLSKRTVEIVHGTVYGAMKYAYLILRVIPSNPCDGVQILSAREKAERKNHKNKKIKFMPFNKIKPFLDNAAKINYLYFMFFKFLIETGCRKGEAMALQWSDIDLESNTIDISKTINYFAKTDEEVFGDTKTYSSKRKIKIPKKLVDDLLEYKSYQVINKKRMKKIYHENLDLVFCRDDGRPLPKSTLYRVFNDLLKKTEIEKIPIHALRHTHATSIFEAGRHKESVLKDIAERLGHSSTSVTDEVYTDLTDVIRNDDIDEFEKYIEKYL